MSVASLPDLELVCAPRSSLSTQKYKPKVGGGQITSVPPWPTLWRTRVPVIYATGEHITFLCVHMSISGKTFYRLLQQKAVGSAASMLAEMWHSLGTRHASS